ncbi:MAG: hypothetical protein HQM09_19845 [Candidatus Riflebacteria bacterium]|nr:hypothetical protein [Candidatus Riflebacteria bacterium]
MNRAWRKVLFIFVGLLFIQVTGLLIFWKERFECRAVVQVHTSNHLDQAANICNVETLRGYLERSDVAEAIKQQFRLSEEEGFTEKPLIPRKFQEVDSANGVLAFRFRHPSAEIARKVVSTMLESMEREWRKDVESRTRDIFLADMHFIQLSIQKMDDQMLEIPRSSQTAASLTGGFLAPFFPGYRVFTPNPVFEQLFLDREKIARRLEEIRTLLSLPCVASETVLRWSVIAPPSLPRLPVWPSRQDLIWLAILNSFIWSIAWLIWVSNRETLNPTVKSTIETSLKSSAISS